MGSDCSNMCSNTKNEGAIIGELDMPPQQMQNQQKLHSQYNAQASHRSVHTSQQILESNRSQKQQPLKVPTKVQAKPNEPEEKNKNGFFPDQSIGGEDLPFEDTYRSKASNYQQQYQSTSEKTELRYFTIEEEQEAIMNDDYQTEEREKRKYVFTNGAIYEGDWIKNARDGYGMMIWLDKSKYEGDWKNNKAQGKGKFTHSNGDYYDGEWQNNVACGIGIFQGIQSRYEGSWKDDQQHGFGVETWNDGSKFEGQYMQGKKKMVQESIVGLMDLFTMEILLIIEWKDKGLLHGKIKENIKAILKIT